MFILNMLRLQYLCDMQAWINDSGKAKQNVLIQVMHYSKITKLVKSFRIKEKYRYIFQFSTSLTQMYSQYISQNHYITSVLAFIQAHVIEPKIFAVNLTKLNVFWF